MKVPTQKIFHSGKLKWTLVTLIIFFTLGLLPLFYFFGINALQRFETLSIILGAEFDHYFIRIYSIVTSSIVLQLLNGSGIIKFDLQTPDGKDRFRERKIPFCSS